MKVSILSKFKGTKQILMDIIEGNKDKTKYFISNWETGFKKYGKVIYMVNLTNMEKLQELINFYLTSFNKKIINL